MSNNNKAVFLVILHFRKNIENVIQNGSMLVEFFNVPSVLHKFIVEMLLRVYIPTSLKEAIF